MTRPRLLRPIVALWGWLGRHHAPISSIGVIVQTLVIVLGIALAVRQLRMLVESEGRAAIRKTATYWDENSAALDSLNRLSRNQDDQDSVSGSRQSPDFAREFSRAAGIFRNLELCIETRECDENLAKRLFCPVAVHAAAAEGLSHEGVMYSENVELYHFATRCFPECNDGTSDAWIQAYREFFPSSEAVRSGRLDRDPEEVSSDFTCTFSRGESAMERYP